MAAAILSGTICIVQASPSAQTGTAFWDDACSDPSGTILHCGLHLCQRDVRSLFQPPVKEELHLPDELGFAPGEEMIRSRNLDLRRAV